MKSVLLFLSLLLAAVVARAQTVPVVIDKPIGASYSPISISLQTELALTQIDDYGPFVTAHVPAALAATLPDRARLHRLHARLAPDFSEIRLAGFTIAGTAAEPPGLPPHLRLTDYAGSTGLYLVQFRSRARPEWRASLVSVGGRTIHYFPENTYLIALAPSSRTQLRSLPGFRHEVVYQPAYKVESLLQSLSSLERKEVVLQLDREQDWQALLPMIRQRSTIQTSTVELGGHVNVTALL